MSFSFVTSYFHAFAAGGALVTVIWMSALPHYSKPLFWFLMIMVPVNIYFAASAAIEAIK